MTREQLAEIRENAKSLSTRECCYCSVIKDVFKLLDSLEAVERVVEAAELAIRKADIAWENETSILVEEFFDLLKAYRGGK